MKRIVELTWGKFLLKYRDISKEIYSKYIENRKMDFLNMSIEYGISISTLKNIKRIIENVIPKDV